MKSLTLRERELVAIGNGERISEQDAEALAAIEARLPAGTLEWERKAIRFGPYCGVLKAGSLTIELLPKVDGHARDGNARGLLVSMLRIANVMFEKRESASLDQQQLHLLDIFILDFCDHIHVTLRSGAIVRYEQQTANLNTLRGRILLSEQVRRNAVDRSRLFCTFDEHTADNRYNRVLKAVLSRLLPHAVGLRARSALTLLLHRLDAVADVAVSPTDIDKLQFDRTIARWKPVFARANLLLKTLFPDVRAGTSEGAALLFDMQSLFEDVLGIVMRQNWQHRTFGAYRVDLQEREMHLAHSDGKNAFRLQPDMTIKQDGRVIAICDAKWKEPGLRPSSDDAYQMTAYASRYGCSRTTLVYPASILYPPGRIATYKLRIPLEPELDVVTVDLQALARGNLPSVLLPEPGKKGEHEIEQSSARSHAQAAALHGSPIVSPYQDVR